MVAPLLAKASQNAQGTGDPMKAVCFTTLILIVAGTLMMGCATNSAGCSTGVGQTGCGASVEDNYEDLEPHQQDVTTKADIDDAQCKAFGGARSKPYRDCRRERASQPSD